MVFAFNTKTEHKNKPGEGTFPVTPIKTRIFVMETKIKFVLKKRDNVILSVLQDYFISLAWEGIALLL